MTNIVLPQGKECSHCWLTKDTLGDYLAFYLCPRNCRRKRIFPKSGLLGGGGVKANGNSNQQFSRLNWKFQPAEG